MANNIGITTVKLPRTLGETIDFDATDELASITLITGEMDLGCMIFDGDGTLGICTSFTRDESGNPIYTIETKSLNAEVDVQNILSQNY